MATKKKGDSSLSLIDEITSALLSTSGKILNIIEFVDQILDAFDMNMFPQQRAILKAIYGLPLEAGTWGQILPKPEDLAKYGFKADDPWDEREILDTWYLEKKTNWRPNEFKLAELNAKRMREGKSEKKHFEYQEIVLQCGMRSGKSSTVGLIIAYEFYKLLMMENPQNELGVPSSSLIYITALASSERQTLGTIFGYVKNYITGSTFFKTRIERGEILVKELEITCPGKNLIIASGHSRADTLVGRTAICVSFDELAMFSADDGKTSNAADVYARVGRATATFPEHSKRIAMSSVKEEGDFMQTLTEDGFKDNARTGLLVFDLSTFDFNPLRTRSDDVIASDYERDPVAAARDYENIRPSGAYAFINPLVIEAATRMVDPETNTERTIEPTRNAIYRTIDIFREDPNNIEETRQMLGLEVANVVKINPIFQSVGHADPGIRKDSFGFACGHAEFDPNGKGIVTVIDLCLEWTPKQLGKGKVAPVDLINVEEILLEIAKARNITKLSFDHWQSQASIQRLYRAGVPTLEMHFGGGIQMKMYELLRVRLNQGLVKIPNHPALVEELKNLQMSTTGQRVDHPKNKDSAIPGRGKISKDLADCVAAVNWHIASQERMYVRENAAANWNGGGSGGGFESLGNSRAHQRINWGFR